MFKPGDKVYNLRHHHWSDEVSVVTKVRRTKMTLSCGGSICDAYQDQWALVTPSVEAKWAAKEAKATAFAACSRIPTILAVAKHWSVDDEIAKPGTAKAVCDLVTVFEAALARTTGKAIG